MYSNTRIKLLSIVYCLLSIVFLIGCASGPSSYFRLNPISKETHVKAAIIPFTNLTSEKDADKKIAYALITHLLSTNYFDIIETGEVQKAIRDAKVRKDEDLSLENIKTIGGMTGADVLLIGVVEEYKIDSNTLLGEKVFVPEVAVSLRIVSTKDASIIWAVNHHRRGDDRVTIFGMGRIDSISTLTDIIIRNSVDSLMRAMKNRRNALTILKNAPIPAQELAVKEKIKKKAPEDKIALKRRKAVDEDLKKAARKETKKEEFLAPVEVAVSPNKDTRQDLKDKYKEEYEKIEKQY